MCAAIKCFLLWMPSSFLSKVVPRGLFLPHPHKKQAKYFGFAAVNSNMFVIRIHVTRRVQRGFKVTTVHVLCCVYCCGCFLLDYSFLLQLTNQRMIWCFHRWCGSSDLFSWSFPLLADEWIPPETSLVYPYSLVIAATSPVNKTNSAWAPLKGCSWPDETDPDTNRFVQSDAGDYLCRYWSILWSYLQNMVKIKTMAIGVCVLKV